MDKFVELKLEYLDETTETVYGRVVSYYEDKVHVVVFGEQYHRERHESEVRWLDKPEIIKLKLKGEI